VGTHVCVIGFVPGYRLGWGNGPCTCAYPPAADTKMDMASSCSDKLLLATYLQLPGKFNGQLLAQSHNSGSGMRHSGWIKIGKALSLTSSAARL